MKSNSITFLSVFWEEVYKKQDDGGDNGSAFPPSQERREPINYWEGYWVYQ